MFENFPGDGRGSTFQFSGNENKSQNLCDALFDDSPFGKGVMFFHDNSFLDQADTVTL